MTLIQALLLAIVQGITEFLPISSSAHLILVPILLGWEDQGLAFDVAVHLGTLVAVVWCFRDALWQVGRDSLRVVGGAPVTPEARLGGVVIMATLPVLVVGFLFEAAIETHLRSPLVIATTTVVFGVLLGWAAWRHRGTRTEQALGWRDALIIGLAQAVALIPGTSRSGITMTAGLMLGMTPAAAARFSFLMAVPVIVLASALQLYGLLAEPQAVAWTPMLVALLASAVSAYACIRLFLALLDRIGFMPFVVYRLLLGGFLFAVFL